MLRTAHPAQRLPGAQAEQQGRRQLGEEQLGIGQIVGEGGGLVRGQVAQHHQQGGSQAQRAAAQFLADQVQAERENGQGQGLQGDHAGIILPGQGVQPGQEDDVERPGGDIAAHEAVADEDALGVLGVGQPIGIGVDLVVGRAGRCGEVGWLDGLAQPQDDGPQPDSQTDVDVDVLAFSAKNGGLAGLRQQEQAAEQPGQEDLPFEEGHGRFAPRAGQFGSNPDAGDSDKDGHPTKDQPDEGGQTAYGRGAGPLVGGGQFRAAQQNQPGEKQQAGQAEHVEHGLQALGVSQVAVVFTVLRQSPKNRQERLGSQGEQGSRQQNGIPQLGAAGGIEPGGCAGPVRPGGQSQPGPGHGKAQQDGDQRQAAGREAQGEGLFGVGGQAGQGDQAGQA